MPEPYGDRLQVGYGSLGGWMTFGPEREGTGLGLAISYQIVVEKHKGTLQCHSQPGQDTEFWIEIPAQQK